MQEGGQHESRSERENTVTREVKRERDRGEVTREVKTDEERGEERGDERGEGSETVSKPQGTPHNHHRSALFLLPLMMIALVAVRA